MLLIHCPYCEEARPELEFRNGGEAHIARSTSIADESDEAFEAFFFIRTNPKGLVYERWRHIHGCGRFFNAVRDSVTDKFLHVYKAGEAKVEPSALMANLPEHGAYANVPAAELNAKTPARKRATKDGEA
ncbi:sarcosine oxidase subunit delta [Tianweitania sediminis]|jgi:sarcosine oxidase subunit delta|uniref:Sarcosine oxidase subunit delta n=1 Tax=Tianweitania sediminis TaxID=1502156 RepID=A0A8J7R135_9HYPH|nr:sarcosine oxidase subunit delta [Tianweitania sediminis]MBP0438226.1 sarcosine oxidase subunit delta [Tianweitania sediminis]HEV7416130.1 sarcosine oxidase subunit delta [Tianweitania sediminis]